MEQVRILASQRSVLKRKLSRCTNSLRQASHLNLSQLQQLKEELHSCYGEVVDAHLEYAELVADDGLAEHRVVNGLDLDSYLNAIDSVYKEGSEHYSAHSNKFLAESVAQALEVAQRIVSSVPIDPNVLNRHIQKCIELNNQYLCIHGSRSSELHKIIVDMNCVDPTHGPSVSNPIQPTIGPFLSNSLQPASSGRASLPVAESTSIGGLGHQGIISQHTAVANLRGGNFDGGGSSNETVSGPQLSSPTRDRLNIVSAYSDRQGHSNRAPTAGISSLSQGSAWQQSDFRKMPLPRFSGDPCDWPEFRAVWVRYIAHARSNGVDEVQLVYQLKQSLNGEAKERVAAIYATQARPLDHIFEALEGIYSDVGSSVQFSLFQLSHLETVREGDFQSLIRLVNKVEKCYSQLAEVDQLNAVNLNHVDDITDRLPHSVASLWMNQYESMSVQEKIHPFSQFMLFLSHQRAISQRYANRQVLKVSSSKVKDPQKNQTKHLASKCFQSRTTEAGVGTGSCVIHDRSNHDTGSCRTFLDLPLKEKFEKLKVRKACFRCFQGHLNRDCPSNISCTKCKSTRHNTLLCNAANERSPSSETSARSTSVSSNTGITGKPNNVVFAVCSAEVNGSRGKTVNLFFDSGSNSTFITRSAVARLKPRKVGSVPLEITTLGGKELEIDAPIYEIELVTTDQKVTVASAYCVDHITNPVGMLDLKVIARLFPTIDVSGLQRRSSQVDMLLGIDLEGLHPDRVLAKAGPNLRVRSTAFGPVVMGSHSEAVAIHQEAPANANPYSLVGSHTVVRSKGATAVCNLARMATIPIENFILGDELGTSISPKCGSCKCSKCPIAGHTYSFAEEQELSLIRRNLRYDATGKRWITKYPWLIDPGTLPNNYTAALATLKHTEKVLSKDEKWAGVYDSQIKDMVDRGAARILSAEEVDQWKGPSFYLSHLAVLNPKSSSTPVRIVFNSSQVYQGFSLNGALAKGPDSYLNSLLGILLRWREHAVSMVADIKKMYNSIFIEEIEQHCHRFLWRGLDTSRQPDIYIILRVNMGDKPAGAISTEAIYQTASLFQDSHPPVATLLRSSTYVDDIVDSIQNMNSATQLAADTEYVLSQAGFKVKHWLFSGDNMVRVDPKVTIEDTDESLLGYKVLGVIWKPKVDVISFIPSINFSPKKKGVHTEPDLQACDVPRAIPQILTRRQTLEQVMKIYDPFGILAPFTLLGKILLRQTWALNLGWDDPLPVELHQRWTKFFCGMYEFSSFGYDRCLTPENAVGNPTLIILSDGSDAAYGCAAYIRWELEGGRFWSRLVMSKCRIAPLRKISTPQMELNGALLSKRIRVVIESEMRFKFSRVYQLVDSETVLHMINKISTRFKVYEGVRIGEIQQATGGNMVEWHWLPGSANVSDWVTRGKTAMEIGPDSEWWTGPSFFGLPETEWPIKGYEAREAVLPGEKQARSSIVHVAHVQEPARSQLPVDFERYSSARTLVCTIARLQSIARHCSFKGGRSQFITVASLQRAMEWLIHRLQESLHPEIEKKAGKYHRLVPQRDDKGIWVVGTRLSRHNPMASPLADKPQVLLPSNHWVTFLLMREAHEECGHRGRDSTLARFRMRHWVMRAATLANKVVESCYKCRRRDPKLLSNRMGQLPTERLKPAPPFTSVMLDMFGPYVIRGEVQKRVSGKGYGVLFTDLFSRAVHIEAVFAYDTQSFLNALARFTSLRGWPEVIYSDCGTQIVAASNVLKSVWEGLNHRQIQRESSTHGLRWKFGPPDAPWQQGPVEALVKTAKRAIHFAIGERRMSASEFMTVCARVANLMNERPLGRLPSVDSTVNLFTPNCLLIGRAIADQPGNLAQLFSPSERLAVIESVMQDFWKHWVELYAPTLMVQSKWAEGTRRDLVVGDVVVVMDSNTLQGKYHVAKVTEVFPGVDGRVRKVAVVYRNCRVGTTEYKVSTPVRIVRAVQRIALLVPVNEEGEFRCSANGQDA